MSNDDFKLTPTQETISLTPATMKTSVSDKTPVPKQALTSIENRKQPQKEPVDGNSDDERSCGLCFSVHGPGECYMTQNPANLLQYRALLLESPEPAARRQLALQAIDDRLASRGLSHLVKGRSREILPHKKYKKTHGGSLKRPASPTSSSSKRMKASESETKCAFCGGAFHLITLCPTVRSVFVL